MALSKPSHEGTAVVSQMAELDNCRNALEKVKSDLSRSRESYVRRERAYKTRIDEMEDELQMLKADKSNWMTHDDKMKVMKKNIDSAHSAIQDNVTMVQDRTTKILQEQERDLLRAFRARLFDVQTELEQEKSRTDDGATKYIDWAKKLEKDLERYMSDNVRLDTHATALSKENQRLKSQFQTQEKDRNYLIQKLVEEKRKAARLSQECDKVERENQRLVKQLQSGKKSTGTMGGMMTLDNFDFASPGGGCFRRGLAPPEQWDGAWGTLGQTRGTRRSSKD